MRSWCPHTEVNYMNNIFVCYVTDTAAVWVISCPVQRGCPCGYNVIEHNYSLGCLASQSMTAHANPRSQNFTLELSCMCIGWTWFQTGIDISAPDCYCRRVTCTRDKIPEVYVPPLFPNNISTLLSYCVAGTCWYYSQWVNCCSLCSRIISPWLSPALDQSSQP